jgi:hypothetical protein
MLAFVADGRERPSEADWRGAISDLAAVEQERTARRCLIVVNFRRYERLHRGDLFRLMRKMNGIGAADKIFMKLAVGADMRLHDGNAVAEHHDFGRTKRAVSAIWAGAIWPVTRQLRGSGHRPAIGADNYGNPSVVSKVITFARQPECAVMEATESHQYWPLPKRIASVGNTTRRKRLVSSEAANSAGASMPVHKSLCTAGKLAGDESPVICGCCEAATMATKSSTKSGFAELLGELLVDTATVACSRRCRTRAYRRPMAIRMPVLS